MTQDASKPHNIFEAVSRLEKERREKQGKKEAQGKASEPPEGGSLQAIFQRCQQLHKEIADSLDQAFKSVGITQTQVRSYVGRPQNFSDRDWRQIEAQKKKNEEMIQNLKKRLGKSEVEKPEGPPPIPPKEEEPPPSATSTISPPQPKPPKKPKVVTRRQWIGM